MCMMTSWLTFSITGPLWGESTRRWWIPLTKASYAELRCFFDVNMKKLLSNSRVASDLRSHATYVMSWWCIKWLHLHLLLRCAGKSHRWIVFFSSTTESQCIFFLLILCDITFSFKTNDFYFLSIMGITKSSRICTSYPKFFSEYWNLYSLPDGVCGSHRWQ